MYTNTEVPTISRERAKELLFEQEEKKMETLKNMFANPTARMGGS